MVYENGRVKRFKTESEAWVYPPAAMSRAQIIIDCPVGRQLDVQPVAWRLPMSALGQKQTCAVQKVMSALPPKADMCSATR